MSPMGPADIPAESTAALQARVRHLRARHAEACGKAHFSGYDHGAHDFARELAAAEAELARREATGSEP